MRSIVILSLLTASLVYAASDDYVEVRDMRLPAEGLAALQIDAGAGSLAVIGAADGDEIVITAKIIVPGKDDQAARRIIESDMVLSLEREGERAVLASHFESGLWRSSGSATIDLEVSVPDRFLLIVDDGSGSLVIENVRGDITIDDGSGSISLLDVGGDVRIDDGSGSIRANEIGRSISIVDGSGSITVSSVGGSVFIDDGSGSIQVSDVAEDFIVEDDGSGSIKFAGVEGRVVTPD
ncbi:MAG: hypothetical protein GXP15_08805 [Gammaproteobacteria bacterium]|nr:hypothetical protein [Gammaproteobacteria bacterium]